MQNRGEWQMEWYLYIAFLFYLHAMEINLSNNDNFILL